MEDLLGQDQDLGVGRNINKTSSYSEDYSKLEELKDLKIFKKKS